MKGLFLMDLVAFKCNAFFVQGGSIAKKSKERHLEKKEGRNGSFTTASGEHRVFTSQCRSVLKGASHFCSPCRKALTYSRCEDHHASHNHYCHFIIFVRSSFYLLLLSSLLR